MIHPAQKHGYAAYIKSIAKACGKDIMPETKLPRKPRADKGRKRGAYEQPERALRHDVLKYLRKRGCRVKRIENSIVGKNNIGLPDLFVVNPANNWAGFVELKSATSGLRPEQEQFQFDCQAGGIKHIVCRCIKDLDGVFK